MRMYFINRLHVQRLTKAWLPRVDYYPGRYWLDGRRILRTDLMRLMFVEGEPWHVKEAVMDNIRLLKYDKVIHNMHVFMFKRGMRKKPALLPRRYRHGAGLV